MPVIAADYRKIIQIVAPIAAALVMLSATRMPAQAATPSHMLVIPGSDGYGFDDCLSTGDKACGQVIADAWCEAHGMSASMSYGRADDITASVPAAAGAPAPAKIDPGSFIVNCKD